jgi:hypothetical protein
MTYRINPSALAFANRHELFILGKTAPSTPLLHSKWLFLEYYAHNKLA